MEYDKRYLYFKYNKLLFNLDKFNSFLKKLINKKILIVDMEAFWWDDNEDVQNNFEKRLPFLIGCLPLSVSDDHILSDTGEYKKFIIYKELKQENIEVYYLDLNTYPFDPLIKQPTDNNDESKLSKSHSYSYVDIKNQFIDYKLDDKKQSIISAFSNDKEFEKKKEKWKEELNSENLNISVDINKALIDSFLKKPFIFKGISLDKKEHDIDKLGLGNIRFVMLLMLKKILAAKVNSEENKDKQFLLIIDEPEAFLHPTWIRDICKEINELVKRYSNKLTVLLSTHSPYVLFQFREYFLNFKILRFVDGESRIIKLKEDEIKENYNSIVEVAKKNKIEYNEYDSNNVIESYLTFDICKLFFEDTIIGVEGISDLLVFEMDKIYDEIVSNYGNLEIIPFFGIRNLPKIYTLLKLLKINFRLICDNDGSKSPDFKFISNLKNSEYKELVILGEDLPDCDIEKFLGIPKEGQHSMKPANILKNIDNINTKDNAKKIIDLLKESGFKK